MKELVLVRHGQSEHLVSDLTGGWTDTPLTATGCEQAERTGKMLRETLDQTPSLVSSDLSRAAMTAQIIGRCIGGELVMSRELRELNNGMAAGLTKLQAEKIGHPVTTPAVDWVPYPGAESWRMMTSRVFKQLDALAATIDGTAVIVTHANSGIAVIQWWLRLNEAERAGTSFELDPCSITWLTTNVWQERTIVKLNDTSHLRSCPLCGRL